MLSSHLKASPRSTRHAALFDELSILIDAARSHKLGRLGDRAWHIRRAAQIAAYRAAAAEIRCALRAVCRDTQAEVGYFYEIRRSIIMGWRREYCAAMKAHRATDPRQRRAESRDKADIAIVSMAASYMEG